MNLTSTNAQTAGFGFTSWMAGLARQLAQRVVPASTPSSHPRTLGHSEVARIRHPRGRRITCLTGALWLTFDGEPADTVLDAGQSIVCEHDTQLLLSAFAKATWCAE